VAFFADAHFHPRGESLVGAIHLSHRLLADAPEDLVDELVIQMATAVGSLLPFAPISAITVSGVKTSTPPSRNKSSWPALARRISGDALTIRLNDTVHFLHQFVNRHLASRNLCPEQFVEEFDSAHSGNFGPMTLGDPALTIPLDGRSKAHLFRESLWGLRE
jgi:hypothetical protein